jgi:hypothetical protein
VSTSSTWGLTREALSQLLAIGKEGGGEPTDDQIGQAMRHRLNSTAITNAQALVVEAPRPADGGAPPTLKKVLLDLNTTAETLQAIKDRAKASSGAGRSSLDKAVDVTVYHAAIAAALVHHNVKITQHRSDHLERSFRTLLDKPWMDPQLSSLFEQASGICHG